jgi:hypothetical protein
MIYKLIEEQAISEYSKSNKWFKIKESFLKEIKKYEKS